MEQQQVAQSLYATYELVFHVYNYCNHKSFGQSPYLFRFNHMEKKLLVTTVLLNIAFFKAGIFTNITLNFVLK